MNKKQVDVELELELKSEIDDAYLFSNGDVEAWVQKSLVISMEEDGDDEYMVTMPEWLAKDRGLI